MSESKTKCHCGGETVEITQNNKYGFCIFYKCVVCEKTYDNKGKEVKQYEKK